MIKMDYFYRLQTEGEIKNVEACCFTISMYTAHERIPRKGTGSRHVSIYENLKEAASTFAEDDGADVPQVICPLYLDKPRAHLLRTLLALEAAGERYPKRSHDSQADADVPLLEAARAVAEAQAGTARGLDGSIEGAFGISELLCMVFLLGRQSATGQ